MPINSSNCHSHRCLGGRTIRLYRLIRLPLSRPKTFGTSSWCPVSMQTSSHCFFVSKITATPTGSPSINMSVFSQQVNGFVGNGYSGFPPAGSNNYVKDTVRYAYTNWSDPHSGEQLLQGVIQCGTDFAFVCPLQLQADYWSSTENALQGAKLYQYLFSHRFGVYPEWAGVPHAAEVSTCTVYHWASLNMQCTII